MGEAYHSGAFAVREPRVNYGPGSIDVRVTFGIDDRKCIGRPCLKRAGPNGRFRVEEKEDAQKSRGVGGEQ